MKRLHVKFSAIFVIFLIPVESYGVGLSRGDINRSCSVMVFECSSRGSSNGSFQLRQCVTEDSSVKDVVINGSYKGTCVCSQHEVIVQQGKKPPSKEGRAGLITACLVLAGVIGEAFIFTVGYCVLRERKKKGSREEFEACQIPGNHLTEAQELHHSHITDSSVTADSAGHGYQSLAKNKQLAAVTAEYCKLIATQGNGDHSRPNHLSDGDRCSSRYEGLKRCGRESLGTNYQSLETGRDLEGNFNNTGHFEPDFEQSSFRKSNYYEKPEGIIYGVFPEDSPNCVSQGTRRWPETRPLDAGSALNNAKTPKWTFSGRIPNDALYHVSEGRGEIAKMVHGTVTRNEYVDPLETAAKPRPGSELSEGSTEEPIYQVLEGP